MTQITTREFRANQSKYFDLANTGEQVMIRRRNQMFLLTPVRDDDFELTPELKHRIDKARKEIAEGKGISFRSSKELDSWLESI